MQLVHAVGLPLCTYLHSLQRRRNASTFLLLCTPRSLSGSPNEQSRSHAAQRSISETQSRDAEGQIDWMQVALLCRVRHAQGTVHYRERCGGQQVVWNDNGHGTVLAVMTSSCRASPAACRALLHMLTVAIEMAAGPCFGDVSRLKRITSHRHTSSSHSISPSCCAQGARYPSSYILYPSCR